MLQRVIRPNMHFFRPSWVNRSRIRAYRPSTPLNTDSSHTLLVTKLENLESRVGSLKTEVAGIRTDMMHLETRLQRRMNEHMVQQARETTDFYYHCILGVLGFTAVMLVGSWASTVIEGKLIDAEFERSGLGKRGM